MGKKAVTDGNWEIEITPEGLAFDEGYAAGLKAGRGTRDTRPGGTEEIDPDARVEITPEGLAVLEAEEPGLLKIGYGAAIPKGRVAVILPAGLHGARTARKQAAKRGDLVAGQPGQKIRSVIVLDTGQEVTSGVNADTLVAVFFGE